MHIASLYQSLQFENTKIEFNSIKLHYAILFFPQSSAAVSIPADIDFQFCDRRLRRRPRPCSWKRSRHHRGTEPCINSMRCIPLELFSSLISILFHLSVGDGDWFPRKRSRISANHNWRPDDQASPPYRGEMHSDRWCTREPVQREKPQPWGNIWTHSIDLNKAKLKLNWASISSFSRGLLLRHRKGIPRSLLLNASRPIPCQLNDATGAVIIRFWWDRNF